MWQLDKKTQKTQCTELNKTHKNNSNQQVYKYGWKYKWKGPGTVNWHYNLIIK